MKIPTMLDVRLLLTRQPLTALLLGLIVVVAGILFGQHTQVRPPLDGTSDPARVMAARRQFQGILIPAAELTTTQRAILDSAAAHQLTVGRVEYAMENEEGTDFARSSMNLPVTGRYADIRAFIESALGSQPAMAIRRLSIQRESADAGSTVTAILSAQFLVAR